RDGLAKGFRFGVLGAAPPCPCLLHRRKLEDHETLRRPVALEHGRLAAAREISTAIERDRWRRHALVRLVPRTVVNLDVHDEVRAHCSLLACVVVPSARTARATA